VLERRSRTTYRPTMTPEGSTHVDTLTGTTSSFSRTASRRVAVVAVVREQVFPEAPWPDATAGRFRGLLLAGGNKPAGAGHFTR